MDHDLTAEIELREKIFTVLRADSALVTAIPDPNDSSKSRVRDLANMPTGYPFPYVAIGAHQRFTDRRFGNDGQKIVIALEIWDDYQGGYPILQIVNMIHKSLPEDNFNTSHFCCIGGFTSEQGQFAQENSTGVKLVHYIDTLSAILQRL